MPIRIYNTLTRRKEEFSPREAGKVSMYVCGVTPYAPPHIGHGRFAVAFDVVRRWLEYRGYEVTYVMNVTDIEDKIFAASQREERDWRDVAEQYNTSYLMDLADLSVLPPTVMPKASDHVGDIIALVERLIETGHAYALAGGDVAFHVPSFPEYGRLSLRDLDQQIVGARVEADQRKKDPRDFFLWKAAKPGEPSWESPWGAGRPGWHIECSAMSRKYLGEGFDLHGGGTDLIFPHHENEIAQSEAASEAPLARCWMHNGMTNVARGDSDEEKMSKSLGNVIGLRETIGRAGGPALRYYYIAAHYRSDIPFDDEALEQAGSALERLRIARQTMDRLLERPARDGGDDLLELAGAGEAAEAEFHEAMDDDFSTPRALAALHGLVGAVNRAGAGASATFTPSEQGRARLVASREALVGLAALLGLSLEEARVARGLTTELIQLLVELRQTARETGQYGIADAVRSRLGELGIVLEDRPDGTTWRLK
jgi:cysteinyl-tRNA synthetase